MYPAAFDYHAPTSLADAFELLASHGDAKLIAGGHSLLPILKLRLAQPSHLIDLRNVPGLRGIRHDGGELIIGAMTTHWDIQSSALVKSTVPVLAEMAGMIADPLVRNRGTIGGSTVHGDPAADYPAALLALEAEMVCQSRRGRRVVAANEWFTSLMRTSITEDEILVELRVPVPPSRTGASYAKHPHPATRFAVAGAAVLMQIDDQGRCALIRIGITGVGMHAMRAAHAEAILQGQVPTPERIIQAAQSTKEIEPLGDFHTPATYKAHLSEVMTKRAIVAALARATNGPGSQSGSY